MKIHLGAGTIFLKNYINVDAAPHYMAANAPKELLEQNTTTFENYYKQDFCKGSGVCIADVKGTVCNMPFENDSAEEIVLIQVLEHIPSYDVKKVFTEIKRVLKTNGVFIVGVPDVKNTAKLLVEATTPEEEDWCIRLIHGTQRDKWSHHYCGYTQRTLKNLLNKYGFGNFEDMLNINFYPAIYVKAYKLEE